MWEYLKNLWYAQGNWKDLVDLHHRFGIVLYHATNGRMSKTNYLVEPMLQEIDEARTKDRDEAVAEFMLEAGLIPDSVYREKFGVPWFSESEEPVDFDTVPDVLSEAMTELRKMNRTKLADKLESQIEQLVVRIQNEGIW